MANFGDLFEKTEVRKPEAHPRRETKWIHYTKLKDNRKQYRSSAGQEDIETLAGMIEAEKGVLQNLLVRKSGADEYEIIAGHHRRKACRYLVEEKGLVEYEFLPCTVENMDDIRTEFQLYSSNAFIPKSDYEKMHELERMKYLLETYPQEFPHLKGGRMVEKLAAKMNMKKTTVGEYLAISKNLTEAGKEAFRDGSLKKSAAVALASLPEEEQEELLGRGVTAEKDIKAYKEEKKPGAGIPTDNHMRRPAPLPEPETEDPEMEMPEEPEDVPESGTPEEAGEFPDPEGYAPDDVLLMLEDFRMELKEYREIYDEDGGLPRATVQEKRILVDALSLLLDHMEGRN